ncbi:MAG: Gfo/Idh/MocA family oxidoreductase [Armatimonadota bacterium]
MARPDQLVKPLNVGVIGCGMMASGAHIPNIARNPQLNLHWLCDLNQAHIRGLADMYGANHLTADYLEVVNDPAVDMLVLATTHTVREAVISAAAKKQKPVYVEKPMAGSPAEVAAILKAVRQSQIPFCVGHNRRSAPATQDAMEILNRWRANPQITPWRLDRNSHLRPVIPEEAQTMVLIRVNDDVLTWKPWAFEEGLMIAEMTHFIDLANLFVGQEPCRVFAMGSTRMNFTILVQYVDGSIATIADSGSGTLDYPKELFEITYQGAMIAIDHLMEIRVMGIEGEPFRRTYPTLDPLAHTDKMGIEGFYESSMQTVQERLRTGNKELFVGGPNKGHYEHLDRFANCVRGEGASPCDAMEGAKATMLTLKAVESCRLGMPLNFGTEEYQILSI